MPPEVESAVSELMAISGKPRELCIQALMAANNIPDVAFEFLMSGNIPEAPMDDGAEGDMYGDEGDDVGAGAGAVSDAMRCVPSDSQMATVHSLGLGLGLGVGW